MAKGCERDGQPKRVRKQVIGFRVGDKTLMVWHNMRKGCHRIIKGRLRIMAPCWSPEDHACIVAPLKIMRVEWIFLGSCVNAGSLQDLGFELGLVKIMY